MTAAGKILYLPVPVSRQLPARSYGLSMPQAEALRTRRDRIYRLAPQERPQVLAYTAAGDAASACINGAIIDLYA